MNGKIVEMIKAIETKKASKAKNLLSDIIKEKITERYASIENNINIKELI